MENQGEKKTVKEKCESYLKRPLTTDEMKVLKIAYYTGIAEAFEISGEKEKKSDT